MNKNERKGITLIALIVTIIVLIILAGVAISMLRDDNGILKSAETAKADTIIAEYKEKINLIQMALRTEIYKNCGLNTTYVATDITNFQELFEMVSKDIEKNVSFEKNSQRIAMVNTEYLLISDNENNKINTEGYTIAKYLDVPSDGSNDGEGYIVIWYTNNSLRSSVDMNNLSEYGLENLSTDGTISRNQAVLVAVIRVDNYNCKLEIVGITSVEEGNSDILLDKFGMDSQNSNEQTSLSEKYNEILANNNNNENNNNNNNNGNNNNNNGNNNNNNDNENNNNDDENNNETGEVIFVLTKDSNNTNFSTLKAAVQEATSGSKITMKKNYELTENITIPEGVTLSNSAYELTLKSTLTVLGKLYLYASSSGTASSASEVKRGKVITSSNGNLSVEENGEFKDYTLLENASISLVDYIRYPYDYTNVATKKPDGTGDPSTSTFTGWRFIFNSTVNGERVIKICTAGVPKTITVTSDDFADTNLDGPFTVNYSGMNVTAYTLKNWKEYAAEYFISTYATDYDIFSVNEGEYLYNFGLCEDDIAYNNAYYFVNSYTKSDGLSYVSPTNNQLTTNTGGTCGVRPIITLKNDLHVCKCKNATNNSLFWDFME